MLQIVLQSNNCIDKSIVYKYLQPLFGMGLFTAPGKLHSW